MKRWANAVIGLLGLIVLAGIFLVYPLLVMVGENSHTKPEIGVTASETVTPTEEASHTNATPINAATVIALRALNVRAGHGVTFGVTGNLLNGESVEVVGACVNGWIQVRTGDLRGWVNADYLSGDLCL